MKKRLKHGLQEYELSRGGLPSAGLPSVAFHRVPQAVEFLERLVSAEPANMTHLRRSLEDGLLRQRINGSDRDIIYYVAAQLVGGQLKLVLPLPEHLQFVGVVAGKPEPAEETPSEAEAAAPAKAEPAPPPPAKGGEIQAAALINAAKHGAPFCAECEKAKAEEAKKKAEKKAAPPPPPLPPKAKKPRKPLPVEEVVPGVPGGQQAAALRHAAAHGAPFCAECEKAKAEEARKKAPE